jgi:hypothetical protein
VDGQNADIHKQVIYKGSMLSGMPNFSFVFGYTNSSWTLRADLVCAYVCRVLNYMSRHDYRQVTPRLKNTEMEIQPFLDLNSGYVQRGLDRFPQQGTTTPWRFYQNYWLDTLMIRFGFIRDDALEFSREEQPVAESAPVTA